MLERKFSHPIHADPDAFYMSIPEVAAEHVTERLKHYKSAVELCSAVGILCIVLAKYVPKVIGVDNDPQRIDDAKRNAKLYGQDNVEFIVGDALDEMLLSSLAAEVAILDPDWSSAGGDKTDHTLSPDTMQPSLCEMMRLTRKHITKNLVVRLPKGFTHEILSEFGPHELEGIHIDGQLKFKVAYFLEGLSENKSSEAYLEALDEES